MMSPKRSRAIRALEKSSLLRVLVTGETNADDDDYCGDLFFPKDAISKGLRDFETAFDWVKAKECGRIEPTAGVDAAVDAADDAIRQADANLENWLDKRERCCNVKNPSCNL